MSKEVEQRVVEMRFDNRQFESNVSTTMSTLDKLKQKLNFDGVSKGFDGITKAAQKTDLSAVGNAVESVRAKFSALEVMGATALANITNTAVNAGKRMVSALTLDPITSGFQEYETQMNAIQTILANTQSKGSTLNDVTAALDELNAYADKTIYNFTEMTRNIGTFTAAGVDLDKSVTSIKGIANLAAVSGSTSQQASTAMYQLSQALAAGKVQLADWNSVVNAGMGGELFQNALKRTATQMGTNVDALIKKYGSFRESLTKGEWLTAEVLTETLTQLSGAYTEADLIAQGYTEKQAKEIVELADTAVNAATKVKTFTQLWDTMTEAAQSGWAQTWKLIFGDFEEAKDFFSRIGDTLTNAIGKSADARNKVLAGALNSGWDDFILKVNEAGVSTEAFTDQLTATAKAHGIAIDDLIKEHGSLNNVISKGLIPTEIYTETLGKFTGETAESAKALKEANQYIVKTGDNLTKIGTKYGMTWQELYKLNQDIIRDPNLIYPDQILKLGDAQLKQTGYTEKEIAALKDLAKQAKETGTPMGELVEKMGKPSGRQMFFASMTNAVDGFVKVLTTVQTAWANVFPPENLSNTINRIIEIMYNFSEGLVMSDTTSKNLRRTLEGLFSIFDIVLTLIGGPFKIAFHVLSSVLGTFDLNILDFTAALGDGAVALRKFLFDNQIITTAIEAMASAIIKGIKAFREWAGEFKNLPIVQKFVKNLQNGFENMVDVGRDAIEGLKQGLKEGIYSVPGILVEIGKAILETIKGVLGIHSPSKEMAAIGEYSIEGLIEGFKNGFSVLVDFMGSMFNRMVELAKGFDITPFISTAVTLGLLTIVKGLVDTIGAVSAPLQGIGDVLSGVGKVLEKAAKPIAKTIKSFSKVVKGFANILNAKAFAIQASAIKDIAIAIAILAGSIMLIAQLDTASLWSSIAALTALAGVIGILSISIGQFGPDKVTSFAGFALALIGISSSLLIMAGAIKKLEGLDPTKATQTIIGFVGIVGALLAVIAVYGALVKGKASKNIDKVGSLLRNFAISLLLMVAVVKLISLLSVEEMAKGGAAIAGFVVIVTVLSLVTNLAGKGVDKLGDVMVKMAIVMALMAGVVKLIAGMSEEDLKKGLTAITRFVGVVVALTLIGTMGRTVYGLGPMLISMSASMLIMVAVVKLLAGMSVADITKGIVVIKAFTVIIGRLAGIVSASRSNFTKLSATLLSMSIAIGILAGVAILLGFISIEGLAKGVIAVGLLGIVMSRMILATKDANDVHANLIVMAVAIAVMATAVAALSFLDPVKLAQSTIALSILMGMFALIVKSASNVNASMGVMIAISATIAVLAGALVALSALPIEDVLTSTVSLSALLLSLSISMKILSGMKSVALSSSVAILAVTVAVAGLATIMGVLDHMNVEPSINTALALSTLLLGVSAACLILAGVGKIGAGAALQGALALDGIILILGGFMAGIGALATYFPQLETFLNTGIGLLEAIGKGIGGFFGSIVGGFISGAASGLPDLADDLSTFMTKLEPFISGASAIDGNAVEAVKSLAGMILSLTAADLISGIASFFGLGGSSLEQFADQLVPFGQAMGDFGEAIKGRIDPESMNAAANAGKMLAELNKSLPRQGGALQNFLGSQDLGAFGEDMQSFGVAIVAFSDAVAPNGEIRVNQAAVEAAANAGKVIADLNKSLPRQGGVLQSFLGSQDLGVFSAQMKSFGQAIVNFSETVAPGGELKVNEEAVEAAVNAGKMLAGLNSSLPRQGGVLQNFLGSQDFETFGTQLKAFGRSIVDFSKTISEEGAFDKNAVKNAASAAEVLVALNNALPSQGGIVEIFGGSRDMQVFGEQLAAFGEGFAEYAANVANVDSDVVKKTASAADSLVSLSKSLPGTKFFGGETTLEEFGKQLSKFGEYLNDYYNEIKSINSDSLSGVVAEIQNLAEVAKSIQNVDTGVLSSFGKGLKDLGNSGIDNLVNAFDGSGPKVTDAVVAMMDTAIRGINSKKSDLSDAFKSSIEGGLEEFRKAKEKFKTAAVELMNKVIDGARSKKSDTVEFFKEIVDDAVAAIRNRQNGFVSAGAYLIQGFAEGIRNNAWKVESEAKRLADKVTNTTNQALDINSPSKVFHGIGTYVVQGFANGIRDRFPEVEKTSRALGKTMLTAIQDFLGIHSPSRVTRDEVGRYVVEGIAEGIESDTSAEEAAEKKAQNIVNAFQDAFDKIDTSNAIADLKYQQWLNTDALNLTDDQKQEAEIKRLKEQIESQSEVVRLANAEYTATFKVFGEDSSYTIDAYKKLLEKQNDLIDLVNQVNDLTESSMQSELDKLTLADEIADLQYQQWENTKGLNLTDSEKKKAEIDRLKEQIEYQSEVIAYSNTKYVEAVRTFGENSDNARELYKELLQDQNDLIDLVNQVNELSGEAASTFKEESKTAYVAYTEWIAKNASNLEKIGYTLAEIQAAGKQISGYSRYENLSVPKVEALDANKIIDDAMKDIKTTTSDKLDVNQIMDDVMKDVEVVVSGAIVTAGEKVAVVSTNSGKTIASGISTGIKSESTNITTSATDVATAGATAIKQNQPSWIDAGAYLVDGFVQGIRSKIETVKAAAAEMAMAAQSATMLSIQAASPSKLFAEIGSYVPLGFANGIKARSSDVAESSVSMAQTAVNSAKNVISRIADAVNSDMDAQPTIRPVIDFSDVEAGTSRLNNLFSQEQAMTISSRLTKFRTADEDQNGDNESPSGSTFQFTQNNYSPKALSRIEIYRQTRNLLSLERKTRK